MVLTNFFIAPLQACLSALGQSVTDEQLDKIFAQVGVKSPGKIVFEEFVDFMYVFILFSRD